MKRCRRALGLGLIGLWGVACTGGVARPPRTLPPQVAAESRLDAPVPLDPAVRQGRLDNGLTWFVRENHKPEKRAELRLVVNAGSTLEDDDQRGLAHFVEHMAFNGTKHFAKQELIDYLERIGMRFGPDINAYTSFDETVYMLQVPTDDDAIVATAFRILEDWSHNVLFEDQEIEKERGVVIEEWRQGRGAWGRIRDKQFPVMFHGSRYADRLVIGDKTTLESFRPEVLRRYYQDWYRPELMAVIAVGDFDADAIEAMIRERFATLTRRPEPRPRVEYPISDHEQTLVSVATDPEATAISVSVGYKRPPIPTETIGDLRQSMVDGLYHWMMSLRLRELSQKADPPFQYGFAGAGGLGRTKSIYQLSAGVRDGGVSRGLETLLTEARRVETHGFTATELERTKIEYLRQIERQYDERDKLESDSFAARYVDLFLEQNPVPSLEFMLEISRELIPGITLAEINARADQWLSETNRVVLVSGPDKAAAGIPDEPRLLASFEAVQQLDVTPWLDQVRDEPLVARPPVPGSVVASESIAELGATRWKLSNGVSVLLKPTEFKNDEIVLRAYSPGGHSLAPDPLFRSAQSASSIVGQMGAGNFSAIELGKALTGKVASVSPYIGETSEGLWATASPRDLETMLQLLYLRTTAARKDDEAWQAYLKRTEGSLQNQQASPNWWFNRRYTEVMTHDHLRRQPLTVERLGELDVDQALAFYRDRFADLSDFQFTIVGNFDPEAIRPQVEKWIGGLPGGGRKETWRDIGIEYPSETVEFEVRRGIEPKSQVRITFHGDAPWSELADHLLDSTAEVLRIRLREVLREDMGGVYGVGVDGGISREPRERYSVSVSFGCDPARVDELVAAVFREIESIKADGPAEANVLKVREIELRERETALERNAFWAGQLEYHERYGMDPRNILEYGRLVEAVTVESVRETARRYLDTGRFVKGVLLPDGATATE